MHPCNRHNSVLVGKMKERGKRNIEGTREENERKKEVEKRMRIQIGE